MTENFHVVLTGVAAHGPICASLLARRIGKTQPFTYRYLYNMVYKKKWVKNTRYGEGGYEITAEGRKALQLAAIDGVEPSPGVVQQLLPQQ